MRLKLIALLVVWAWGASFVGYALYKYSAGAALKIEGDKAVGIVQNVESVTYYKSGKRRLMNVHTIAFTDQSGKPQIFKGNGSNDVRIYPVGDKVELVYPPGSPADARINDWGIIWLEPLIFGVLGVIIVVLGSFLIRAVSRYLG